MFILLLAMARVGWLLLILAAVKCVSCSKEQYHLIDNTTISRQILEFKIEHTKPIGLLTVGSGDPVEIRNTITINSDLFKDDFFLDHQSHLHGERIPLRIVQAKGFGAWGYFEVTNDVSKYTKADVFNGVGKKTTALVRFAVGAEGGSGTDLGRDIKDMSVKLYTNDGILDFLSIHVPQFSFKEPNLFPSITHAFSRRNPKTHVTDINIQTDIITLRPESLPLFLFFFSDYGLPDGWTHTDFHPIHTYEINNEHNERWYVRFNWRTEQGVKFLTTQEAREINDPDYYIKDMYNSIANKHYPCWRLEIDILSLHDIQTADFNPFDVTRRWKNGTYHTETIGRLVLNKLSENQFRDVEQAAFSPSNLVPGIPGPVDTLFRARRFAYRDAQNFRISRNHLKAGVNSPDYAKSYVRDGHPPVLDNGKDAPNYFPNSFNGPLPFVDDKRPKEQLQVLETNAVDLQESADFYNKWLPTDASRQRLADNLVEFVLSRVLEHLRKRTLRLLTLIDKDLARRVIIGLHKRNINTGFKIKYEN